MRNSLDYGPPERGLDFVEQIAEVLEIEFPDAVVSAEDDGETIHIELQGGRRWLVRVIPEPMTNWAP